MYSFFYCTFTCASTNNLDSAMNSTFHAGWSSPDLRRGTVVLHAHRGRKGNKLKRRREREREARQNESEKEEARLEVE